MFNLDKLNDARLEILHDQGWAKGCIPKSPDSFIESLVQKVDRGRFKFEVGDSSNGPRLVDPLHVNSHVNPPQPNLHANPIVDTHLTNLESTVGELSPFELLFTLRLLAPTPRPQHSGVRKFGGYL